MEANDASLGSGDATTRAQELRASLGARQDAESMVAEASKIRQEAVASADALVEEAQQLSAQLVRESRELAEEATAEARERSDGILARARLEAEELADRARSTADAIRAKAESDVEEHRRRVRAEVTDQVTRELTDQYEQQLVAAREQSAAMVTDLEASVRILSVSLESAMANVSELLGSLEAMRATSETGHAHVGQVGDLPDRPRAETRTVGLHEHGYESESSADPQERRPEASHHADPDAETAEPASYDVGNAAPASAVPSAISQFRAELEDEPAPERPRSATEAFLTSSSLELDQATRELRDLQHPEDARRRRSEESRRAAQRRELEEGLGEDGDPDPDEPARPLGWLFRTAQ